MNARTVTEQGPLSASETQAFQRTLKRRYRELWDEIRSEIGQADAESFQQTAGEAHDLEDEAAADVTVDVNLAAVHRDILEMRDIEAALERVVGGTYGTCTDCGEPVGAKRLQAYPTAKRCHPCQERRERQYAHAPTPKL